MAVPISPVERTQVAGKELLVLEIDVDGIGKLFAIKERTHRDLDAPLPCAVAEGRDLVGPGLLIIFQYLQYIGAVLFFADKQQALEVLGFPGRLDDIARPVITDKVNRIVEAFELLVGDD